MTCAGTPRKRALPRNHQKNLVLLSKSNCESQQQNSVIFSSKKIQNETINEVAANCDFLENSAALLLNNSEDFFGQNNFEKEKNDYGLLQTQSPSSVSFI